MKLLARMGRAREDSEGGSSSLGPSLAAKKRKASARKDIYKLLSESIKSVRDGGDEEVKKELDL